MASNESSSEEDNANANVAFSSIRLFDALREGGDIAHSLTEAIVNGDTEQLQHWYELIAEVSPEELHQTIGHNELVQLLRILHLLMQWEHAQGEELKEVIDREVTETAEKEESWREERDALKDELNAARGRAEMGDVSEAFREEIDALKSENAQLKQLGKDRDSEMVKMGQRTEQLEEQLRGADREKAVLINNQAQLEDAIRELNRRLDMQSETNQQGADWEARKLRQRNEQALVLSEQVNELADQNEQLREEVDRLSGALEEANGLLKENTARFVEFNEQFEEAEKQLERLRGDNCELRKIMEEKEKALKERTLNVDVSGREFTEVVQAKDVLLEKQRIQLQQTKAELEQCRFSFETAIRPNEQREEELERLRVELIDATETARKLFGVAPLEEEQMEERAGKGRRMENGGTEEGTARELRLRLIQMDQQLEERQRNLEQKGQIEREMEQAMEQKDWQIMRLLTECQRYRKMAFGDTEGEMERIEKQLEYRDKQIEQLNRRCSELQIELEQYIEKEERAEKQRKEKSGQIEEGERKAKRKKVTIRVEEKKEEEMDEEETGEAKEEEEEYREEPMKGEEEEEKLTEEEETERKEKEEEKEKEKRREKGREEKTKKREGPAAEEQPIASRSRKSREQLLREATDVQALHCQIIRLIGDIKKKEDELVMLRKQYNERGTLLKEEKEAKAKARRETDRLRELLLFNDGDEGKDPLDRLKESEEGKVETDQSKEGKAETDQSEKGKAITDQSEEGKVETVQSEEGKAEQIDPFKELRNRERIEALELENAELRRFVENVAENGKDERERRMAEGTRRLVFLAVKETKLERRLEISKRLRMAMGTEMRTMKDRLSRVLAGEEAKSRQLFLENEAKLFELARLQNVLLHSVPVHEYNRLLREHKCLLRDRFMSSDMGYHSETEEQKEDDDFVDKLYAEQHLNIGRTVGDWTHLHMECGRLREMNDVLRGQNDTLNSEREKLKAELDELNAFLDDIEAETELKSMLANIERRFLQALREQFECAEEREALERELRRSERNFSEARGLWLNERRRLVDTVGHLSSALQRFHRDHMLTIPGSVHVTPAQLEALATHLRKVHQQERKMNERESAMTERAEKLQRAENALRAKQTALETIMDRDGELRAVHAALQGYVLNEVNLSTELQRTRKKLEKMRKEMNERTEELEELREMLIDFQTVNAVDLKQLERQIEQRKEAEEMDKREEKGKREKEEKEKEEEKEKRREKKVTEKGEEEKAQEKGDSSKTVIIVDNSNEWAEQMQQVREQAKLCVDTYKEQLESRDKTLDEYRQMVEQLRAELTGKREAVEQQKRNGGESTEEGTSQSDGGGRRTDEWEAEEAEERWERRTRALERQLRRMEEEHTEAERERTTLKQTIRAKQEQEEERERRNREGRRDVKVQVNIKMTERSAQKKGNSERGGQRKGNAKESSRAEGEERTREEDANERGHDDERDGDEADLGQEAEEADSSGTDGGGSDSGTVEDIEQKKQLERGESRESISTVGTASRKSKASTRTIVHRRSVGGETTEGVQDIETMLLRHRNETRRLRMRVMELERRNRELSEQYSSLRERSRLAMRTRTTPSAEGADSVVDALRRENERLQRQNTNLNKSLEKQREEAEQTAVRMRRIETQNRANAEAWEERKRQERNVAQLRKRIEEGTERERLLQERLERRERHIEQLSREQQGRLADGERVQTTMAQWRAKVAQFEQRETTLGQERVLLGERCNELTRRLEAMAREHGNAKKRLAELTKAQREKEKEAERERNVPQMPDRKEAHTQTEEANKRQKEMPTQTYVAENKRVERIRSAPPSAKEGLTEWEGKWPEDKMSKLGEQLEETRAENQILMKKLRRAELLQRETEEQLEAAQKAKERLHTEHNALIRMEKRRTLREEKESVGMALLRDKLAAKEREVSAQRHRIIELERKLWHLEMAMESEQ